MAWWDYMDVVGDDREYEWSLDGQRWLQDAQGRSLVLLGLEEFRQHLGGQLSIPMLNRLGQSTDVHHIELPVMEQALLRLSSFGGPDFAWTEGCAR